MASTENHVTFILGLLQEWQSIRDQPLELDGISLTVPKLAAVAQRQISTISVSEEAKEEMTKNFNYLVKKLQDGHVIYGVNTGYGGSANVRCSDVHEVQRSLIRHLNVGFGDKIDPSVVRSVMSIRANSLCLAYSAVRPDVVDLLCDMINADVVPVVPLRGTISASGDLLPTSYIAACMSGRPDAMVIYNGKETLATEALKDANITPIEFQAKEALGVVNSASFSSALAANVLFDASIATLLTQVVTALTVESLRGRMESFHPTVHRCLPHKGNQEVARNMLMLLDGSKFARHELESGQEDDPNSLKQDRYPLRTAAQWLGPTTEILMASVRRVTVELNSANDNPIIDHRRDEVMHGGNFQGISTTIAMDQARQALQLCGKLVFAQLSETLNHTMNNGLPPNLSGCDVSSDFGFKGMDTATASYSSELDYLTNPLTNHVLSAEMHNQSVNSMAFVSGRMTREALKIVQMMLTNAFCVLCQAIDLRWLECRVLEYFEVLLRRLGLKDEPCPIPWYHLAYNPVKSSKMVETFLASKGVFVNGLMLEFVNEMKALMNRLKTGEHVEDVSKSLGKGTKKAYDYVRKTLQVGVHLGSDSGPLDRSLERIFDAIQNRHITDLVLDIFESQ